MVVRSAGAQRRRAAPQLETQGLGEPHGGVLARGVVGLARRTDEAGGRSDDHYVPAATLDHGRQKGAGHPEQGQSVDPKGLLDLLVGELEQGAAAHHAGVVHEDVDRPGGGAYPLGGVDHLLAVADVAAVAGGRAGALGSRRGGRLCGAGLVQVQHAHRGAERGAAQREAAAQPRGAARDEYVLAGDGRHDVLPSLVAFRRRRSLRPAPGVSAGAGHLSPGRRLSRRRAGAAARAARRS